MRRVDYCSPRLHSVRVPPDGSAPSYLCPYCGAPVRRRSLAQITCGASRCRSLRDVDRDRLDPARREARRARWASRVEADSAYLSARVTLRRAGLLTPERESAIAPLRGAGRVPLHEALARCGLAGVYVPQSLRGGALAAAPSAPAGDSWALPSPSHHGPIAWAYPLRLSQGGIPRLRVRDYGGARVLHGALHRALGLGHTTSTPRWSLSLPSRVSPRLYLIAYRELPLLPPEVLLAGDDAPHALALAGPVLRVRPPPAREPGSYRARVEIVSPLVLRRGISGAKRRAGERDPHELQDAPESLSGALLQVAHRIGCDLSHTGVVATVRSLDVERVLDDDGEDGVRVGGHWRIGEHRGRIQCLVGWLEIECNAIGRWLLDCAALVGLGAKSALGFGRVRVEDR